MSDNESRIGREDSFLLQEHREIWDFVRKITDLEHRWLNSYYTIVAASFAALGVLYKYLFLQEPKEENLFWIITSIITFCLVIVSLVVWRNMIVLRDRSVEYRNHLNIIRYSFIHESDFESNNEYERMYLSRKPDQRFMNIGAELSGIRLLATMPALVITAFSYSLMSNSIELLGYFGCYPTANWIPLAGAIFVYPVSYFFIYLWFSSHGQEYDKKMRTKLQECEKNRSKEEN